MNRYWKGSIQIEEFEADVNVTLIESTDFTVGDWFGNGIITSDNQHDFIFVLGETFETVLGTIIINSIEQDGISFTFGGAGNPLI